jgi:hypothetical protein
MLLKEQENSRSLQNEECGRRGDKLSAVRSANNVLRLIYIVCGIIFFGLGIVGTVLPLLPTTPLIILAAVCFGKSSKRLHAWCISTRFYKNTVEDFVSKRTMKVKAKLLLLSSVTLVMGLSFVVLTVTDVNMVVRIILSIIWLCHVIYFGFVVKTISSHP